jgi:hypothetical protein
MAEVFLQVKCCNKSIIVLEEGHLKHGGFLFPYTIAYCSGCGKVKSTTFIKDAIKD